MALGAYLPQYGPKGHSREGIYAAAVHGVMQGTYHDAVDVHDARIVHAARCRSRQPRRKPSEDPGRAVRAGRGEPQHGRRQRAEARAACVADQGTAADRGNDRLVLRQLRHVILTYKLGFEIACGRGA